MPISQKKRIAKDKRLNKYDQPYYICPECRTKFESGARPLHRPSCPNYRFIHRGLKRNEWEERVNEALSPCILVYDAKTADMLAELPDHELVRLPK